MFLIAFVTLSRAGAQTSPAFDRAGFASDFAVAVNTLRENHPKLQLIKPRASFDSLVRATERGLPSMTREQSYVALMRMVASLEDGHTGFELASFGFRRYPIEVTVFADGIYVTRTGAAASRALGWRLTRIGRVPIDTLRARLRPYLTADNEPGRWQNLPPRLATHELLVTVGAANESGAWFVSSSDSVWLPRPEPGVPAFTLSARDTTQPLPDYLVNRARRFWWKSLPSGPDGAIMYAQLNSLAREAPPFASVVDSLFDEIEGKRVRTLILDIRNNGGGDGTLAKPLVQRIIRTPAINQRGHLFVITGRATFSAAVILAAALENETNATFVGEPTGAPANHYGEPARMELPATKLRFSYSRFLWQNGDPRDRRQWIAPTVPTLLEFQQWQTNGDPAVETILSLTGVPGRVMPVLSVAGVYPTVATVLADGCGGSSVADNPTTIEHTPGQQSMTLTHAGIKYDATVRNDGTFTAARQNYIVNGVTYDLNISGEFTGDGFRAYVTIGVRDPRRNAPCQYTVAWNGLRTSGLNTVPGR